MSDKEHILQVRDLTAGYGDSPVLFGINMACPLKGAVAVLGRNGAGKTTLMKTLIGEIKPNSGAIEFAGLEQQNESTEKRVRNGMGYVPQEQSIFTSLTVRENLTLGGISQRNSNPDMVLDFFPKLGKRLNQKAGTLSGGERKMLAVGRALLGNPKLLMLDEPTEGVWIGVVEEIAERLEKLAKEISIIIVEQDLKLALRVAQYVYVMDRGVMALQGPSEEIENDPQLIRLLAP